MSIVGTLLASASPAFDIVDQSNPGPGLSSFSFKLLSLGQSFTPAFSTLSFVELPLYCCAQNDPGNALVRVDIRDGGIAGPVIGSSTPVLVLDAQILVPVQFVFAPPIALTPSATYAIEVVQLSGGNGAWSSGENTYAAGVSYTDGVAAPLGDDRLFKTGVLSDEPPQLPTTDVPVEYSNLFDEGALPGGGQGPLDPGQVLYTEPPDTAADGQPSDTTDFFPGIESGAEPDAQIDAIANGVDYLEFEVARNDADLVVSLRGDPVVGATLPVAAFLENRFGFAAPLYTQSDLDSSDGPGVVEDVDGIELWGPLGADDAFYYSREGDVLSGVSVWAHSGGVPSAFVTHAVIVAAVTSLGFSGTPADVDLDALMVRNVGAAEEAEFGDEILFSIREVPTANFDGGEIIRLPIGGVPTFLAHGGHVWDTAFGVAARFGGSSEEVDALEAFPSPATIPALGVVGLMGLAGLVVAAGAVAVRHRTGS